MTAWHGTAALRPGRFTYTGQVGAARPHRHAAVQIVVSRGEPLAVRDGSGVAVQVRAAIIPSGVEHELLGAAEGVLAWVDADDHLGRALTRRVRDTGLPTTSAAAWAQAAGDAASVGALLQATAPDPPNPALRAAIDLLPSLLDGPVRLHHLAAAVGISASRLGHLFTEELGLPFRAYVRWIRLHRAIDHFRRGGTITDAAHAAGFADGAHLTRACHEMLGLAPSHLARGVTISASSFKP
ncbi:helix-turn-helix domain-containing protein [Actinokineospora sp. NPDC004072]